MGPVLSPPPEAGETLVLSVEASEDDRDWAARTAVAAIREWSATTDHLFVLDLDPGSGGIAEVLEARAAEGVSDLLLFGASLNRVVQTIEDDAFHFVPAGTPVASFRDLLSHEHWNEVVRSFRDAGAVLVLYLPVDQPGSHSILERADRIVRLGWPSEGGSGVPTELRERVAASLAPPDADLDRAEAPESPAEESFPEADVDWAEESGATPAGDLGEPAPGEAVVEVGAGVSDDGPGTLEGRGVEDVETRGGASPWPGPVVDIRDLAPDGTVVAIEELAPAEPALPRPYGAAVMPGPVVDIGDLAPDEPVVDIADLAPDEPVGIARSPDEEVGIPEDELGVEGGYSEFPEQPSPEAEAGDEVVPFGPETGEVEEMAPPPGKEDFEEESFAAGLDAIDEAAEAGKQPGLSDFDLGELDALSESAAGEEGPSEEDHEGVVEESGESSAGEWEVADESFDEEAEWEEPAAEGLEVELPGAELPEEEAPMEPGPPEEGEWDFGDRDLEEAPAEEAATTHQEDDLLGLEGFSGEMDVVEDEGPDTGDEAVAELEPLPDAGMGGEEMEEDVVEAETGDDLGADLVTGPDFGQPTSGDEDERWRRGPDQETAAAESGGTGLEGRPEGRTEPGRGPGEGRPERDRPTDEDTPAAKAPVVGVESGDGRDRTWGRPVRLLALMALLVVGAVAAHWYDVIDVPGLDRALATVLGPAGMGAAPTVETVGIQPSSPIQTQSLLVDTYRDAQSAADVALALRGRLPDRVFAVAPVQSDGDVTFQLLAGPANTGEQAAALRRTLAGVLTREDASAWTPRPTSLAFLIEETETLEAARARADAVTADGVFGYVLRVTYPDDATAYRVYAGGYADPEEARALRGILSQAGVDATFTERRGEIPE